MDGNAVERVRSFNRLVTQRVGALNDRYLARGRPLGAARVLWEVGEEGCDVRLLRSRLDLDSGYLSRLLRSLEAAGLVTVDRKPTDRRTRTVRLTPAGRAERDVLDRRSDELARSFLDPLDEPDRHRLVTAMAEVERLLLAALVAIAPVDPASPDARHCVREYFDELAQRFEHGFRPRRSISAELADYAPPAGMFLIATLRGEPVGCGGLRFEPGRPAYLKRMWVSRSLRGLGIGRRLLGELERSAKANGATAIHLETNRALTEAINLYRSAGYQEVEPFNDLPYAHHWFEKQL
jgi:DNA-binding MarR family transcriptional regulator/GNAT superfamily N-acetyltransferase